MKVRNFFAAAVLSCSSIWAADLQPLDIKPGLWESTHSTEMPAAKIPPEMLAKMKPKQRAVFEERMKAANKEMGLGAPKITTHMDCVKEEDLDKPLIFEVKNKECTRILVNSNGHKQEIHFECQAENGAASGTIVVEVIDSEHVKGTTHATMAPNLNQPFEISSTFTAKWLGAACKSD